MSISRWSSLFMHRRITDLALLSAISRVVAAVVVQVPINKRCNMQIPLEHNCAAGPQHQGAPST